MALNPRIAQALSTVNTETVKTTLEAAIGLSDLRPKFRQALIDAATAHERNPFVTTQDTPRERWERIKNITEAGRPIIDLFSEGTQGQYRTTRPHVPYDVHAREVASTTLTSAAPLLNDRTEPLFFLRYALALAHDGGEDHLRHETVLTPTERRNESIKLYDEAVLDAVSEHRDAIEQALGISDLQEVVHDVNEKLTMGRRSSGGKEHYANVSSGLVRSGSFPARILALDTKTRDRLPQTSEFLMYFEDGGIDKDLVAAVEEILPSETSVFDDIIAKLTNLPKPGKFTHDERVEIITSINKQFTRYANRFTDASRRERSAILAALPPAILNPDHPHYLDVRKAPRNRAFWEWNVELFKGQLLAFKIGHFLKNQYAPRARAQEAAPGELDLIDALLLDTLALQEERLTQAIVLERLITFTGYRDTRRRPLSIILKNRELHAQAQSYMLTQDAKNFQKGSRAPRSSIYRFNATFSNLHKVEANINGARADYIKDTESQLADAIIMQYYTLDDLVNLRSFIPKWFAYRAGKIEIPSFNELYEMSHDFPTVMQKSRRLV